MTSNYSTRPSTGQTVIFSVPAVWTAWFISRAVLGLLILANHSPRGDVAYYFFGLFGDDPTTMTEYPHQGTWPVEVLGWIIGERLDAFYIAFVIMCVLFDALFLALVLRNHNGQKRVFAAGWLWALFGTAAGQVFYMRLDIFPGLTVAASAAAMARWPYLASALLAFATTMKLWPGVLAAGLVGRFSSPRSWGRLASFFAAGIGLCAVTFFTNGLERLTSPLTYQDVRGLQIESVPATHLVFQSYFSPEKWDISYAASKSFEIAGPGVEAAIAFSDFLMLGTVLFALGWALYRFIVGGWTPRTTVAFFTVMVALLLVSNKIFSPQYIIWLGPLLVVAIRQPWTYDHNRFRRIVTIILGFIGGLAVIAAALGTYIFPFVYFDIVEARGNFLPYAALALRNALVGVIALLGILWLVFEVRAEKLHQRITHRAKTRMLADAPTAHTTING
ncbi:MAG: DUF2029 domain-containing protein [Corynebacterium sp.]|nr:DUF2029 domain-containing protein [Corynebacterium sp.]